jgi:hypothetical protein
MPISSSMPIHKVEMYDADVLEGLLRHEGVCETVKKTLRQYKKRRINGNRVQIQYDYPEKIRAYQKGRIYPQPHLGLATFPRDIRHALSAKYYQEVDMENSQPTLLSQICDREGLNCPHLKQYVLERESILNILQQKKKLTRDEAKDVCISVVFGAYIDFHPLLPKIYEELKALASLISSKYPLFLEIAKKSKIHKEGTINLNASALAHYAQDLETNLFLKVADFLESKGFQVDVYQHDGGEVLQKEGIHSILREAEGHILQETGFKIKLLIKPITCSFDFSQTSNLQPSNILINDSFAAKKFVDLAGDSIQKVGTEIYSLRSDGIWETGEHTIRSLIHKYETKLVWRQYNQVGILKIFDYGGDVVNISKMIKQIPVWCREGEMPLQFAYSLMPPSQNPSLVALFLELVHLVSGKNQVLADYVLRWIAHILQFPYDLPGVMLILSGNKGVGKDTLFDFLMEFVLGKYASINYSSTNQFFDKHDTGRKGMFLAKLEEAERKGCVENASVLKSILTSKTATFNPKLIKPVTVPNFTRLVFTTNKGNPVAFNGGERRFVILPCSSEKKGDTSYWNEIRQRLFTNEGGSSVAAHLLNVDLSGFNIRELPPNTYQDAVIESEATAEEMFIDEWDGQKTAATELYSKYIQFCQEKGYLHTQNSISFGKSLLPFVRDGKVDKKRTNGGIVYWKTS